MSTPRVLARGRRLLAAGTLAAALALAGVVFGLAGSGTTGGQADASVWQQALVGCARGQMTFTVLHSPAVQDCLLGQMVAAVDAGQFRPMQEAVTAQVALTPDLYYACHDIAHRAGRHAFEVSGDAAALLDADVTGACVYGFGHGVLDGFGETRPDAEQFRAAGEACGRVRQRTPSTAASPVACADGLGHAAWQATGVMAEAAGLCALLPDGPSRRECGEGVVMQAFEPAGSAPRLDDRAVAEQLTSLCGTWPSGDIELLAGCGAGAGYMLTRPAWRLQVAWTDQHGQGPLTPDAAGRMTEALLAAADGCRALDSQADACLQSVAVQLPPAASASARIVARVCPSLGAWQELCRSTRISPV